MPEMMLPMPVIIKATERKNTVVDIASPGSMITVTEKAVVNTPTTTCRIRSPFEEDLEDAPTAIFPAPKPRRAKLMKMIRSCAATIGYAIAMIEIPIANAPIPTLMTRELRRMLLTTIPSITLDIPTKRKAKLTKVIIDSIVNAGFAKTVNDIPMQIAPNPISATRSHVGAFI